MAPVSSHPENSQLRAPCVLKPLRGLFALVVFVLGAAVALAQSDLATLRAQAEAGDPVALNALGNLYANGQGVTRDDAEALRQYTLSAERSYAPANFNLGMMYELGRGVSTDITRAFSYYLKAAQQGFAPAQYNVGNMYAGGLGVGQDNFEAVLWFTQAADQGVAEAQYNLGLAYELGRGVSADAIQAQRWYGLSAEQGYARANYNLAVMKEEGRGSAKDEAGAAEFYLAAAQLGFGPAQNNYGIMLAEGRGGLKANPIEALVWLSVAVENGINPLGRDLVAKQLSSSQLAQANARLESMRNGASGTAQSGPGPAQVAAATGADEQLRKQLQAMKAENDRLLALQQKVDEERANLSSQLQSALAENSQLAAKVDIISRSIAATQKDPKSDPKITYLMEENTRLNNEVTRSTKELSSILRQLRVANSKSNSAPQPSGSSADSDQSEALSSLRQEVASLRDDNQRLTTESRKQVAGNISPIEIHNLRDQVASGSQALAQLTEAKQQITTLSQELENTKEAHKTALAAKTELEGKLTAAGQAQNGDNAKVQRLEGLVTEAQNNLVSSQREMEGLKVQLNSTQAEFRDGSAAARAKISEIETVARQLEVDNKNLTGQVASLQIALSAADIRPVSTGDSSRIQALESELNSSRQIARELSQRLSNLENEQARLSLEKDNALNQVTELQRNLAAKGSDAVRSVDLESKLNASKSAERRLAQQLAGAESERNRLALENEEVIRQIAQLRQSLAANGGDTARAADLGSKLNASKSAESRLAQQLADTELDRQRFIREQQDTKNQLAILQRQLQDSQENQSAAEATLQPKLDEANTQLSSLFAKLQNLDSANRDLEQANSDLKNQITKLTAENQQLATTSRSNASQSSQATDQTARLNAEIDEAARVIAEREATIKELTVQMSSLHSDLDNSRKSAAAALAAQAQAAQALPDARATLMEIQSLQAQVSVLENQLGQERSQSAEAMAKLSDQLNRANETSKSLSDANRSLILGKNSNTETLESDLQDAQTRADELAAINASLVQERVEQRAQFEAMAFKLSSTEKQLSDMQSNEAASKAAANKAQDELQKLQAKFATSDTALNR